MPTFRTTPSGNLTEAVRRLVASGGGKLTPMQELQADQLAAETAQKTLLAEKARAEVEAMNAAEARRNDPALRTEYAAHSAGIDMPDATRLYKAISGAVERPIVENDDEGNRMPDVTFARPENLPAGSERVFRSALASAIANNIATGKTNAAQLAQAGERINKTALTNEAANTTDIPTANRIVAAVAGRLREPFKLGTQGQVINEEVGTVNEGTALARAAADLSGARTATEGARQTELGTRSGLNVQRQGTEGVRQTELGTRSTRNTAAATLASERAAAIARGETGRGGARVTPQQVERWVSEVARKEWDTIPASQRKGMNYEQHLAKVRERFKTTGTSNPKQEIEEAHAAIAKGADPVKVAKRFKERLGFDMPQPALLDEEDVLDLLEEEDLED